LRGSRRVRGKLRGGWSFAIRTAPLPPFPVPQDCFGGCTDSTQGFYGMMDEVGGGVHLRFVGSLGFNS
jgi:hypothetical protein